MQGVQLARALANIVSKRQELDQQLKEHLSKWVKSTLSKNATLEQLRGMSTAAGPEFIAWSLGEQSETELLKVAKRLDPHLSDTRSRGANALRSHLMELIAGAVQPSAAPIRTPRGRNNGRATEPSVEAIFQIASPQQRRMELEKLSPAQLKAAIRNNSLDGSSLSSKPTKV